MKPQLQLHRGGTGVYGDCYRTCLAMVLDMDRDAVPHFCQDVPPGTPTGDPLHLQSDMWEHVWLAEQGLTKVTVPHSPDTTVWDLAEQYHRLAPDAAVILQVSLYGRQNHAVVLYNGRLFDPLGFDEHTPGLQRYHPSQPEDLYWVTILARATNTLTQAEDPASVVSEGTHN